MKIISVVTSTAKTKWIYRPGLNQGPQGQKLLYNIRWNTEEQCIAISVHIASY